MRCQTMRRRDFKDRKVGSCRRKGNPKRSGCLRFVAVRAIDEEGGGGGKEDEDRDDDEEGATSVSIV